MHDYISHVDPLVAKAIQFQGLPRAFLRARTERAFFRLTIAPDLKTLKRSVSGRTRPHGMTMEGIVYGVMY